MKAKKIKKELDIYDTTQMRSEGNQKWKEVQQNSVNREYWSWNVAFKLQNWTMD